MSVIAHNVELKKEADGRILKVSVSGKLTKDDYEVFVPEIDKEIERHDEVRILFDMVGLRGWTLGALFEDTKFAIKHYSEIDRIAIVGDKQWERGMAVFCKPFTKAKLRYFDIAAHHDAKAWLREGLEV